MDNLLESIERTKRMCDSPDPEKLTYEEESNLNEWQLYYELNPRFRLFLSLCVESYTSALLKGPDAMHRLIRGYLAVSEKVLKD